MADKSLYSGMRCAGGPAGLTRSDEGDEPELYPVVVRNPVLGWSQWTYTEDPDAVEDYDDWEWMERAT